MFNSSEIAALKEQNAKLTADHAAAIGSLTAVTAELTTAKEGLATITAEKVTLEASVSDLATKLSASEAAKAAAEAQAKAAEASIETKVTERLASAGVDPVKRDPSAKQGEAATTTRAEFEKMGQEARNSFMQNGGKIAG